MRSVTRGVNKRGRAHGGTNCARSPKHLISWPYIKQARRPYVSQTSRQLSRRFRAEQPWPCWAASGRTLAAPWPHAPLASPEQPDTRPQTSCEPHRDSSHTPSVLLLHHAPSNARACVIGLLIGQMFPVSAPRSGRLQLFYPHPPLTTLVLSLSAYKQRPRRRTHRPDPTDFASLGAARRAQAERNLAGQVSGGRR